MNESKASRRLTVIHSYHALNEDSNAKQAMYWSPDGFQLIVADVGRLIASEYRTDQRSLRLHFLAQTPRDACPTLSLQTLQVYLVL